MAAVKKGGGRNRTISARKSGGSSRHAAGDEIAGRERRGMGREMGREFGGNLRVATLARPRR